MLRQRNNLYIIHYVYYYVQLVYCLCIELISAAHINNYNILLLQWSHGLDRIIGYLANVFFTLKMYEFRCTCSYFKMFEHLKIYNLYSSILIIINFTRIVQVYRKQLQLNYFSFYNVLNILFRDIFLLSRKTTINRLGNIFYDNFVVIQKCLENLHTFFFLVIPNL